MANETKFKGFRRHLYEVQTQTGDSALRYRGKDGDMHYVPTTEGDPTTYFTTNSTTTTISNQLSAAQQDIVAIKSDMEKVVNALKAASFEGSNVPQLSWVSDVYSITNTLSHATTSNPVVRASKNSSFTTTLEPASGYEFGESAVSVTMGGDDITDTAYSASTGEVTITEVTGNVVITATGSSIEAQE